MPRPGKSTDHTVTKAEYAHDMPAPDRAGQILDAAFSVFARLGFGSARMEDVAAEAGLSKGALYLYFRGKDQLIDALVDRMFNLEMGQFAGIDRAGSASVRLENLVSDYVEALVRMQPLGGAIMEMYARATRHHAVQLTLQRYLEGLAGVVAGIVAEGVAQGEFRAVDPDTVAAAILGLLEGLGLLWTIDPERVPLVTVARESFQLVLAGLRPDVPPTTGAAR